MADAQTIDQLAIEITTSITGEKKLQRFSEALSNLARVSRQTNTNNLQTTASNVKAFNTALQGIKTNDVKNLANALYRLSEIKAENVGGLDALARSITNLTQQAGNTDGITRLTNSLARLSKADMSGFNGGAFNQMTNAISMLVTSLAGAEQVDAGITRLVSAIAKLGSSGEYIGNVTTELPKIGSALTTVITSLQGVGTIDAEITKLVDGLARLTNAGKKAAETTSNLDKFGDAVVRLVKKLQGVGTIDTNLANAIHGLGNLASSGVKFGNVAQTTAVKTERMSNSFRKLGSTILRVVNPFNSLRDKLGMTQKRTKGLASSIGLLYAKFFMLFRIGKWLGKSTGAAQDYVESFNYFNTALQKIGQDSKNQYKRFGYDNAKAYADSFQDRFTNLQKQMTGYDVDSQTGELNYSMGKSLGLNINDVMNYQAQISQITNSTGQLGEVSIAAGKAMSMLAADLSSLTNTDVAQVQENLLSGMNGMTRAVYKYGINITSASLQQIAYNHGIDASVAKMSMATKQQLRLIGMLEQSKVAWGDLGKTIDTSANQMRMMQAGFANLSRTIGALFLPALQMIYPVLNGIIMVLQEFFGWLGKLIGVKMPDFGAIKMPDVEQPADDMGDLADNTDKAQKKAKKLSDNLQGFDEINKLDKNTNGNGSGSGSGATGVGDYDLSNDLNKMLKQYQRIWDKFYKNNENKAYQYAKKIKEALIKGWNNGGDFTFLGLQFGEWLSEKLAKIPWEKIQNGVNKVTKSFATFLNGVVKGTNWTTVGNTIAQAFNTIVGALYTWWDQFDFLQLGKSLAEGLNAVFNKIDWKKLGSMLGKKLRGMIQLAFGFITNINFENIGQKISDAINSFLKDMGAIDPRTGLSGWAELGKTFSDGAKGLLDTIITVLDNVDWDAVARAISDFMSQIDWVGILVRVGKVIAKALWVAITTGLKAFANDPFSVGGGLLAIFGGMFAFGKLKGLLGVVKGGFGKLLGTGIKQAAGEVTLGGGVGGGGGLFGKLFSKVGGAFKNFGKTAGSNFMSAFTAKLSGGGGLLSAIGSGLKGLLGTGGAIPAVAAFAVAGVSGKIIGDMVSDMINAQTDAEEAERKSWKMRGEANNAVNNRKTNETREALKGTSNYGKGFGEAKMVADSRNYQKSLANIADAERDYAKSAKEHERIIADLKKRYEEGEISQSAYQYALERELALYSKDADMIQNARAAHEAYKKEMTRQRDIQKKLNELRRAGIITGKQYKKMLDRAIISEKGADEAVASSISNMKNYKDAVADLTKKMSDAKVPTEQQKVVLNKLKDALKNGRITMKEYKKMVAETGGDVTKLGNRIDRVSKKKLKVNVDSKGLKEFQDNLKKIVNGKYTVHINTVYDTGKQAGQSSNLLGMFMGYDTWSKGYQNKGVKIVGNEIQIPKNADVNVSQLKKIIKEHDLPLKIKRLAKGGFLEDGLFTMNRGEIAGRFDNGKSVVANNYQVSEGISKSLTQTLAPAIHSAVKQAISESVGNGDRELKVYLDGRQIAENSVKHIRNMNRSHGTSVFA